MLHITVNSSCFSDFAHLWCNFETQINSPSSRFLLFCCTLYNPGAGVSLGLDSSDARARVPWGEEATSDGRRQKGIHSAGQLLHSRWHQEYSVRTKGVLDYRFSITLCTNKIWRLTGAAGLFMCSVLEMRNVFMHLNVYFLKVFSFYWFALVGFKYITSALLSYLNFILYVHCSFQYLSIKLM